MNTTYRIDEHWDTSGVITAESNAAEEFKKWQEFVANSDDWEGDEFAVDDFENYINDLREWEAMKNGVEK